MSNDHYQAKPLKICLIAGETSGDMLGEKLMTALNKISNTTIQFSGIGGERMEKQGLDSFFPISDLSIMGISEILPYIPPIPENSIGKLEILLRAVMSCPPSISPDVSPAIRQIFRGFARW